MADMRVQELFTESSVEMRRVIPGDMSVDLRDRHIEHVVADLASKIVRTPGTNPRGMTVTITSDPPTIERPQPDLLVVASAPMYV
jgi:hypothetical protein